jgi:hypothetical protein
MIHDGGIAKVLALLNASLINMKVGNGAAPAKAATDLTSPVLTVAADNLIDGIALVQDAYLDETQAVGETLTEAGVFDDEGNIFASSALSSFAKTATNSLTVIAETEVVEVS